MSKKNYNSVMSLVIVQLVMYLIGFYNFAAHATQHHGLFNNSITSLSGLWYWSLLSMFSVAGFVIAIYVMTTQRHVSIGLVISAIAFASPTIFMFFLIIPATFALLGIYFMRIQQNEMTEKREEFLND